LISIVVGFVGCTLWFASSVGAEETAATLAKRSAHMMQAGDFQSATEALREGLRQYPASIELWNLLGIAESESNRADAAKEAFLHGLKLAPGSISLNENIGFLFYREADYRAAVSYLERAVALGSEKPGVRFSLAASWLRTGASAKALSELRALEPSLGNRSDYWVERGTAELSQDAAAADASFSHALQMTPHSIPALNGAAYAAEKQGLDEKALAFLIQARNAAPDDVPTLTHFGALCIRRDLGLDALDALTKAHKLQPANNAALYLLARANISLENWQQAFYLFAEFARRVPRFGPTYFAMGWLDIKLDRVEQARAELQKSLALEPNLEDARYELAQLDLDNGQLNASERLLEEVLKQDPHHAKANMAMGDLLMRKGKLADAEAYLETAIHEDPKLAPAHYKLSMVFFRKHEMEQAEKEKTMAVALDAQASHASRTQLRLELPESDVSQ
jgi:tetratricopeptide (TPR) repeat protein